jgi:hypothetical protein
MPNTEYIILKSQTTENGSSFLPANTESSFEYVTAAWNRDSSVGVATGYGLDSRGWIPGRAKYFSFLHIVDNGSEAHTNSYPVGKPGSFPGGKAAGT